MTQAKVNGLAHLVLRVRDLERSVDFYTRVLGMHVVARAGGRMAFLNSAGAGDKSHELGLLALGAAAPAPDPQRVGLYHFAWPVDSVQELESFHQHLVDQGVNIVGYGDHGISMGVYFTDPDGNEMEVFYELPKEEWPQGKPAFRGNFPLPVHFQAAPVG